MRAAALLFLLLSPAALAEDARFEVHLNLMGAWGDLDFADVRAFPILGREITAITSYDLNSAVGFDAGVQVNVVGPLGFRASVSRAVHDGTGLLTAALVPPIPGLPRSIEAEIPGGQIGETAAHLDGVLSGHMGRVRLSAFGGVTFFRLEARLLDRLDISFPGGRIPVVGAPSLEVSDSPIGWNAGIGLDVDVSRLVGIGGFVRYSQATAYIRPPLSDPIQIEAGGAHAALGVRLRF